MKGGAGKFVEMPLGLCVPISQLINGSAMLAKNMTELSGKSTEKIRAIL
jgi:hypothetical protein